MLVKKILHTALLNFQMLTCCLNLASRYQFQNYPASHHDPAKIFSSRIPPSILLVSRIPTRFCAPSRILHPAKPMLDALRVGSLREILPQIRPENTQRLVGSD